MYFDHLQEIGGQRIFDMIPDEGSRFPDDAPIGYLFSHTYHGLCVYCHDDVWRKVLVI